MTSFYGVQMQKHKSTLLLLGVCFVGLILAVLGAGVESNLTTHKNNWLVNINGHDITESDLLKTSNKLSTKLSKEETLSLMMDNTLLIQRARDLGLIESDRVVKKAIVHSVVETTVREAISTTPPDNELQEFYQSNIKMFTSPKRATLSISKFDTMANCTHHDKISNEWLTHKISHPANQGAMTEALLNRQFGPALTQEILSSKPGQFIHKKQQDKKCLSLYIHSTEEENTLPYSQVERAVLGEYRIQARRKALSDLLIRLKDEAEITLANQVLGDIHEKK